MLMSLIGFLFVWLYIDELQQRRRQDQMSWADSTSEEESDGRMKRKTSHRGVAARFRFCLIFSYIATVCAS